MSPDEYTHHYWEHGWVVVPDVLTRERSTGSPKSPTTSARSNSATTRPRQ